MLEEAAVLSRMSQSSIVSLLSLDSLPGYHYLVLEVRRSDGPPPKGLSCVAIPDRQESGLARRRPVVPRKILLVLYTMP